MWREYFDFKAVNEFGEVVDVDNMDKYKTYLLAQLPHAIMVGIPSHLFCYIVTLYQYNVKF